MKYLWRAVDHEGEVLESFVSTTRDKAAALNFMKKRAMLRFRRMKTLQQFASTHASLHNHFNQERHLSFPNRVQSPTLSRTG